jgi:integrase/recombinase XerD
VETEKDPKQMSFLLGSIEPDEERKSKQGVAALPELTKDSTLASALTHFELHMQRKGFTANTIKAFRSDLHILEGFLGKNTKLSEISTEDLLRFIDYVRFGRGKPASEKSVSRRITTLKVFFSWLKESDVTTSDPAEPLVYRRVQAPLPEILSDRQVRQLVETARDLAIGRPDLPWKRKPDTRPYLLLTLLLYTGIKKGECMRIRLEDIDREEPSVWIKYDSPRFQHKTRKLLLPQHFVPVLDQYVEQYNPTDHLFTCTARNLEYNLKDLGEISGVKKKVSFEILRWTFAVRAYRYGTPPEQLKEKLGISDVTWNDVFPKIKKLASPGI